MEQWEESAAAARAADNAARGTGVPLISPAPEWVAAKPAQRVAASRHPESCKAIKSDATDAWCGMICSTEDCPVDTCKCADVAAPVPEKQAELLPAGTAPDAPLPDGLDSDGPLPAGLDPDGPKPAAMDWPLCFRRDVEARRKEGGEGRGAACAGPRPVLGRGGWRKGGARARGTHGGTEAGPRRRRAHGAEGRRGAAEAGPRRRRARGTQGWRGAAEDGRRTRTGPTLPPRPPPPRRTSPRPLPPRRPTTRARAWCPARTTTGAPPSARTTRVASLARRRFASATLTRDKQPRHVFDGQGVGGRSVVEASSGRPLASRVHFWA